MERIIAQNGDEIMHIIRTSKNTQSACSQIQRQFEVGYIKAKQIINYLSMSPLQIQSQSSMFNDLIKMNVTKTFGKFKALDDLSMTVPKGCVYGLVGPAITCRA